MPEEPPGQAAAPQLPPPYLPPPVPVTTADGGRRYDGITYARISGYRPLLLDLHAPPAGERPAPLVLWVHGGGWAEGDRRYPPPTVAGDRFFDAIVRSGLAVATIDYRHSLEAPFPAQLHDLRAAIRYLRLHAAELGLDTDRLALWGESAGAHLAVLAALAPARTPDGVDLEGEVGVTDPPSGGIRAVVDWYGPTDLRSAAAAFPAALAVPPAGHPFTALIGADPAQRPDLVRAATPLTYADHPAPPFLIVHGTADRIVPHDQSRLLAERLEPHTSVELVIVPGADHIFAGAPDVDSLVQRSIAFLAHHLAPDPGDTTGALSG
ncbi:alpha/beta hydrolase [Kitasatospora viridis]|uniref:Acetyl esterase/lipase n=1 Tax=Kitasatospora viridis TaxID=281105 RepID=A0A561TVV9_9ACTN|nr:alpha/beta hydrolase [Kitasatospora viridis]TWF91245.1 acetyl esterase/lipase [Kitasatospora viridis]